MDTIISPPSKFRKHLLASLICTSLFTVPETALAQGQVSVKGGEVSISDISVETTEDSKSAVISDGEVLDSLASLTNVEVKAQGINAAGLSALNGGRINVNGGTVTTQNSVAIEAVNGGKIDVNGTAVSNAGVGKSIIDIRGEGSQFTGSGLTLTNTGASAKGISVSNKASVTLSDIELNLANGSNGLHVDKADLTINSLTLNQSSVNSQNVVYVSGDATKEATITLNDSNVQASGANDTLINANIYSHVTLDRGEYKTTGDYFSAIYAATNTGKVDASNVAISTEGNTSHGADIRGSMSINNSSVSTTGSDAHALYSEGSLNADTVRLVTEGSDSGAMVAARGGSLTLKTGTARTTGARGYGAINFADSTINASDMTIDTEGDGSHALLAYSGSNTTLSNVQVKANGINSVGLFAQGDLNKNSETTVNLQKTHLSATHHQAMNATGANLTVNLTEGSSVSSGNGQLITVRDNKSGTSDVGSTVRLNADGKSALTGDILTEAGNSTVDVSLSDDSTWTGSSAKTNSINIDTTSLWDMTTSSAVNALNNNGSVNFRSQSNGFSTLTINNDLTGSGSFNINTHLGDDSSPTDKIDVKGNVDGNFTLAINNAGGSGALTTGDGIEVVNIDGSAKGTFALSERVAAGAYEYQIAQGGSQDSNDWYLRSTYLAPDPNPDTDPDTGTDPDNGSGTDPDNGSGTDPDNGSGTDPDNGSGTDPDNGSGTNPDNGSGSNPDNGSGTNPNNGSGTNGDPTPWRAEVTGYIAAPWLVQRYAFDTLGTYHQRTGGDIHHKDGAWGLTRGSHLEADSGRFGYDSDSWFVQFGTDVWEKDNQRAGVMLTLGTIQTDVTDSGRAVNKNLSVDTGSIDTSAYSLGGYYTAMGDDGAYLDIVGQASWYENDYQSTVSAKQHGYGAAASAEVGKPFQLYQDWHIEPQLQARLQYMHLAEFNDGISDVSGSSDTVGELRAGARLFLAQPEFTPYVIGNVVQAVGKEPDVTIGGQKVRAEFGDDYWQTGVGLNASLNSSTSVYIDGRYQKTFDGSQQGYNGNIGVKATF